MLGRKQLCKAGKARSTFSLLVMSFSMHTHSNVPFPSMNICTRNQWSHLLAYFLLPLWSAGPICCADALAGVWMCRCVHRQSPEHKHKDSNIRTFQPEPDTATLKPEMWTSKFSTPQKERTILHDVSHLSAFPTAFSLSLTYTLFLIPSLPLHFKPWEKPRKRSLPTKGPFHCIVFSS